MFETQEGIAEFVNRSLRDLASDSVSLDEFKTVQDLITTELERGKGVLLAVPHIDCHFQLYLAKQLSNIRIDYLFVEIAHDKIEQIIARITREISPTFINSSSLINYAQQNFDPASSPMLLPVLFAHFIHNIPVIGVDNEPVDPSLIEAFYRGSTASPLAQVYATRILANGPMARNIQSRLQTQNERYIFLCGPMHGAVSKTLRIRNIKISLNQVEISAQGAFAQDPDAAREAAAPEVQPDYIFLYEERNRRILFTNIARQENKEVREASEAPPQMLPQRALQNPMNQMIIKYKLEVDPQVKEIAQSTLEKGLRRAAFSKVPDDVDFFLKYVKNVNAQDADKQDTALHIAVRKGCVECVQKLLDRGADPEIRNKNKRTALQSTESTEILELLNKAISRKHQYQRFAKALE